MKLCIFIAHEKYEFYFDYSQRMKYQQALQKAPVCTKISTNAYTV